MEALQVSQSCARADMLKCRLLKLTLLNCSVAMLSIVSLVLQVLPNDAVRCNPDRGRIQSGGSLDLELTLNFLQPQQV